MKHLYIFLIFITVIVGAQAQTSRVFLNGNSISAFIRDEGAFFQDEHNSRAGYGIKGDNTTIYHPQLIYNASLWFGGIDESDSLRFAGTLFNTRGRDFFSGPFSSNDSYGTLEYISNYIHAIWTVSREEIVYHIDNHTQANYVAPSGIANWPGNGITELGVTQNLAPFIDVDGDNIYNPSAGDYPCIRGDMASYVIMNDMADEHTESGGLKMGLEIHVMFYQFAADNYIDSTTFFNVRVINRGNHTYNNFKTALYMDADIGCSENDYTGCDSTRNMMYAYNGTPTDASCAGSFGFGDNPPAVGVVSLKYNMEVAASYSRQGYGCAVESITTDPYHHEQYWGYMNGYWLNGAPFTYGGCGYEDPDVPTGSPTNFMYSGNPYTGEGWTEENAGHPAGDRRGFMALESVTLNPGEEVSFDYAVIMNQQGNYLENVQGLLYYADSVKIYFDNYLASYSCIQQGTGILDNIVGTEPFPYDRTFEITRIDGRGNMGLAVDLTDESVEIILDSNFIEKPIYKRGRGPIDVKVVDPENHALGYFQLKFNNYGQNTSAIDTASWTIYRYENYGGDFIDSVVSESTINIGEEQFISQWGITVVIEQNNYFWGYGALQVSQNQLTTPIEATLEFENPNGMWLTGVKDMDWIIPQNWILSGHESFLSDTMGCYIDNTHRDSEELYENLLDGMITHFSLLRRCGEVAPITGNSSLNVGTAQNQARMASANGVDLVFTSDKTKWTRSAVIELCQDPSLAEGSGVVSKPRIHPSVDKNGYSAGHPNYNASEGNLISSQGMGWFPGYAIDVETGRRLNIVFGENSAMPEENGADMIWNPTTTLYDNDGNPKFGGQHVIYVIGENINGSSMPIYDSCQTFFNWTSGSNTTDNRNAWKSTMWVMYPLLEEGRELLETDVKIRMRVVKAYENYEMTGENEGRPMFEWNLPILLSEMYAEDDDGFNGIDEFLNVFPNPTNSSVIVHWEHISAPTLRILSSQGYVVYETVVAEGETFKQLNIEHLTSGLYFVEFGGKSRKLILQK